MQTLFPILCQVLYTQFIQQMWSICCTPGTKQTSGPIDVNRIFKTFKVTEFSNNLQGGLLFSFYGGELRLREVKSPARDYTANELQSQEVNSLQNLGSFLFARGPLRAWTLHVCHRISRSADS